MNILTRMKRHRNRSYKEKECDYHDDLYEAEVLKDAKESIPQSPDKIGSIKFCIILGRDSCLLYVDIYRVDINASTIVLLDTNESIYTFDRDKIIGFSIEGTFYIIHSPIDTYIGCPECKIWYINRWMYEDEARKRWRILRNSGFLSELRR